MTIGELNTLLSHTGLPPNTPVAVRVFEGGAEHTAGLSLNRVQVVRQLHTGNGHPPEFVLEIVVTRAPGAPMLAPAAR
jgi:hypothetical protein